MTIVATGTVAALGTAGAVSGALTGMTTGSVIGLGGKLLATRTINSVAGATGASAPAGAILGSAVGGSVGSEVVGSAAGVVTSAIASTMAASAPSLLMGPMGCLVLGVTPDPNPLAQTCTFDCWKPIVHDSSEEPSKGMLLRDIARDPRIKNVTVVATDTDGFPELVLENVWNERFRIEYVMLPTSEMAAHAVFCD